MRSHEHKRKDSREICKICNKSFISLNGHMKKHLNDRKNAAKMLEEFEKEDSKEKKVKDTQNAEKVKSENVKIESKDGNVPSETTTAGNVTVENSPVKKDSIGNVDDNVSIEFVVATTTS